MAIDGLDLISSAHCGAAGPPHRQWRDLRSQGARMEWMEPAGEPAHVASSFVVGPKHLPVRYKISN